MSARAHSNQGCLTPELYLTFEFLKLIINMGHQKIKEQEQLGLRGLGPIVQLSSETKNVSIILGMMCAWLECLRFGK